jgi:hypothetical protein
MSVSIIKKGDFYIPENTFEVYNMEKDMTEGDWVGRSQYDSISSVERNQWIEGGEQKDYKGYQPDVFQERNGTLKTYLDENNIYRYMAGDEPDPVNDFYCVAMSPAITDRAAKIIEQNNPELDLFFENAKYGQDPNTYNAAYDGYAFKVNFADDKGNTYSLNVIQMDAKTFPTPEEIIKYNIKYEPTYLNPQGHLLEFVTGYDPEYSISYDDYDDITASNIDDYFTKTAGVTGDISTHIGITIDDVKTLNIDESGKYFGNFDYDRYFKTSGVKVTTVEAYDSGPMAYGSHANGYQVYEDKKGIPVTPRDSITLTGFEKYDPLQVYECNGKMYVLDHYGNLDSSLYEFTIRYEELRKKGAAINTAEYYELSYIRARLELVYIIRDKNHSFFSGVSRANFDQKVNFQIEQNLISLSKTQTLSSPLVLDTDGNGFSTNSKQDGVYFDLDNNGFAEKTAWTSGDAFLTYDLNENGKIDNGGELFGNHTLVGESKAADGFAALAQYDDNADGVIDENDDIYHLMRLWNDDGDGVSEDGEFKTLEEMGVNSIDLNQTAPENATYTDATVSGVSIAEMSDGTSRTVADFWFNVSTADTMQIYDSEFDEDILALPDVRSFGKMPSLRVAMQLDESGVLKELVADFIASRDVDERDLLLKQIFYKMTGADAISPTSRGSYIDARDLHVLETMLGATYYGQGGKPYIDAAAELKAIFSDISRTYSVLLSQETITGYLNLIDFTEENGIVSFDATLFNLFMDINIEQGNDVGFALRNVGDYLHVINNENSSYYAFVSRYLNISADYKKYFIFDAFCKIGTDSVDNFYGSTGNENFFAGKGNDTIYGGKGNDTYYFNLGDGKDVITDEEISNAGFNDKIVFGEGISSETTYMTRQNKDLIIRINGGTEDEITIRSYFYSQYDQIEKISFADGTEWTTADIATMSAQLFGTNENDRISAFTSGANYSLDQTIHTYDGDDTITGSTGNENFFAGKGNDTISGGKGNDTYYFNLGDGKDVITDSNQGYSDSDKIVFGEGINSDDLIFSRDGYNLKIAIAGTDDSITVNTHFYGSTYRIENFQTADGSLLSYTNIDYLIQAMAEFTADTGMTTFEAAQENNQAYSDIVNQMWVSQTTA